MNTRLKIAKSVLAAVLLLSARQSLAEQTAAAGATDSPAAAQPPRIGSTTPDGYTLVWSDEFDRDGPPDPAKWTYQNGFVRNKELQWYQPDNARCEKGLLIIEARRERKENPNYSPGSADWKTNRQYAEYTSADLVTKGIASWQYGRFEMRARIDTRQGMWPAFWAEGITGKWPYCGEVDIMEFYRRTLLANFIWSAHDKSTRKPLTDFSDPDWSKKFHVWRLDWDADRMTIYVDGVEMNTLDLATADNDDKDGTPKSPYRQPFFLLLNLAVGSTGGDPTPTTFPARFEVDYVRVYHRLPKSVRTIRLPTGPPLLSLRSPTTGTRPGVN